MPNDRTAPMEQLKCVSVSGLFGRFNHTINFDSKNDVVIITAPNGYGKTVVLRIIDSLFKLNLGFFTYLSFSEIEISFQSGKRIFIEKTSSELFETENIPISKEVLIQGFGFEDQDKKFTIPPEYESNLIKQIEMNFPVGRVESKLWIDHRSDDVLTEKELIERYGNSIGKKHAINPPWLENIATLLNTHLVETQRLLSLNESSERYGRARKRHSSVVENDARDLSSKISNIVQKYALESQQLDQSFPKRFIEARKDSIRDVSDVKGKLEHLNNKQADLREVGLIGKAFSDPIDPNEQFDDELIRRVLSIYIDDTEQKLSIFDQIYDKINLFKEILDSHFTFKKMLISQDKGISILDVDSSDVIPLTELSSGEQHELVLIYELLFKVADGSLILIDEPELSLHVAWQKKFISDLQKIQNLRNLNVIIATHSPQIINDNWDLVQDLKS